MHTYDRAIILRKHGFARTSLLLFLRLHPNPSLPRRSCGLNMQGATTSGNYGPSALPNPANLRHRCAPSCSVILRGQHLIQRAINPALQVPHDIRRPRSLCANICYLSSARLLAVFAIYLRRHGDHRTPTLAQASQRLQLTHHKPRSCF